MNTENQESLRPFRDVGQNSYRACGSQKGQFYHGMSKFLLLWEPWKGTRQSQPQAAAVATIVALPIILRHRKATTHQEHLYQQRNS